MKKSNRNKTKTIQNLASARIDALFLKAEMFLIEFNSKKYADACVLLARRISLRYKVPFTKTQKILFCKRCNAYLRPTKTSRVRFRGGRQIVMCLSCKNLERFVYN